MELNHLRFVIDVLIFKDLNELLEMIADLKMKSLKFGLRMNLDKIK